MPKHSPIYFDEQSFSEEEKGRLKKFLKEHPVATSIGKVILATAVMGGVLTLSFVAPGIVKIINRSIAKNSKNQETKERYRKLWNSFYKMKKRNLFEIQKEHDDGSFTYKLTEKGKIITKKFLLETLEIPKPKNWDKKWRVVAFDIPEKYKKARRALQHKLDELGFFRLQKSVWVYPFPCESEIAFLKDVWNIRSCVEIFTTEDLKNGKVIYHFQHLIS